MTPHVTFEVAQVHAKREQFHIISVVSLINVGGMMRAAHDMVGKVFHQVLTRTQCYFAQQNCTPVLSDVSSRVVLPCNAC